MTKTERMTKTELLTEIVQRWQFLSDKGSETEQLIIGHLRTIGTTRTHRDMIDGQWQDVTWTITLETVIGSLATCHMQGRSTRAKLRQVLRDLKARQVVEG